MKLHRKRILLTSVGALAAAAAPALAAPIGYSLGDNGNTLVSMSDLTQPDNVTGMSLSGGAALNSLAFRPQTGQLYGFAETNNTVYEVDRETATLTPITSTDDGVGVAEVGFDFNNQIDAARVVSTSEDNIVFFPEGDEPANIQRFTDLFYPEGDVNAGADPSVFANAYTNQVPDAATTQQFVLDSERDILATLANNAGTLETIGQITVDGSVIDFTSTGGFDIFSPMEDENIGYALLTTSDGTGLYQFDSFMPGQDGTVSANFLGMTGTEFGPLDGLAVFETAATPAPIPLPAGVWLLGSAVAGIGLMRRRKRA